MGHTNEGYLIALLREGDSIKVYGKFLLILMVHFCATSEAKSGGSHSRGRCDDEDGPSELRLQLDLGDAIGA